MSVHTTARDLLALGYSSSPSGLPISTAVQAVLNGITPATKILAGLYGLSESNTPAQNQAALDAVVAAATALRDASPAKHYCVVIPPGNFQHSGDFYNPPGVSLDMTGAELTSTSTDFERYHFSVGGMFNGAPTKFRYFLGLKVRNSFSNYTTKFKPTALNKMLYAGVRLRSMDTCKVEIISIEGFRIGALEWPDYGSTSYSGYNVFYLGSFTANSIDLEIRNGLRTPADTWANSNVYLGGNFMGTSAMRSYGQKLNVVISTLLGGSQAYGNSSHAAFHSPCFQTGEDFYLVADYTGGIIKAGQTIRGTNKASDGFYHCYEAQNDGTMGAGQEPTAILGECVKGTDNIVWKDLGKFYRTPIARFGTSGVGSEFNIARGEGNIGPMVMNVTTCGVVQKVWQANTAITVGQLVANMSNGGIYLVKSINGNATLAFAGNAGTVAPSVTTVTVSYVENNPATEIPTGGTFLDSNNVLWEYVGNTAVAGGTMTVKFFGLPNDTNGGAIVSDFDITKGICPAQLVNIEYVGIPKPPALSLDFLSQAVGSANGWVMNGAAWLPSNAAALTDTHATTSDIVLVKGGLYAKAFSANFGYVVDTRQVKRFLLTPKMSKRASATNGRFFLRAYDVNMVVKSWVHGTGSQPLSANGITGSYAFTNANIGSTLYGLSAPAVSDAPVYVSVAADVEYLWIGYNSGDVAGLVVEPILNTPQSHAAAIHQPFTRLNGARYAKGTPTHGYFLSKEILYNYNIAPGQPMGWYISTPGILVPAFVTGSTVIAGELRTSGSSVYEAQAAGTSGATAPTGTSLTVPVSDGTINWLYVGPAAAFTPITTPTTVPVQGSATLVAGTVTVADVNVTASTVVSLSRKTATGTVGTLTYTVNAGVGFTVTSTSNTETSVVGYSYII